MRRFVLYAAAAAAMTGAMAMTSQAAVGVYVAGGNRGGWTGGGFGGNQGSCDSGYGNTGNMFSGNGCSTEDIFQMLFSSNPWSGSFGSGSCDDILIPNCPDTWENVWQPECPAPIWPDFPGCGGNETPGIQNPGTQNPGIENPGTQNPGTENPGTQNPGTENPGNQNPGTENPGNQNPGTENPGTENPGTQNPGTQNPGIQNPGTQNPGNQTSGSEAAYIQRVIELVNEERAKAGLSPVTESSDVTAAADVRAQEITRNFSHTRPNGTYYTTALDQIGVRYMGSGENIAYGQQTPEAVMSGWMNSQGHRANILERNFTKIGVSCYENANGVKYWVQLFTY